MSQPQRRDVDEANAGAAARALVEAEVDAIVSRLSGRLPERELAWMREQLLLAASEEPELARLARAAAPRDVDQSGEVLVRPAPRRSGP